MSKDIPQHKRLAMGQSLAMGGSVRPLKTGIPDTPIEKAKRANGVPGMKKGGGVVRKGLPGTTCDD